MRTLTPKAAEQLYAYVLDLPAMAALVRIYDYDLNESNDLNPGAPPPILLPPEGNDEDGLRAAAITILMDEYGFSMADARAHLDRLVRSLMLHERPIEFVPIGDHGGIYRDAVAGLNAERDGIKYFGVVDKPGRIFLAV